MATFLKAQVSSALSTAVDFTLTILLKELLGAYYMAASVTGTICGGITNFLLGRNWTFASREQAVTEQMIRYIMVWVGNLGLNALIVYVCTDFIEIKYWVSKIMASLIVGVGYNYVLQKVFVFRK